MHVDKPLSAGGDFVVWGKTYRTISITEPFQTWYTGKSVALFMSLFLETTTIIPVVSPFLVRAKYTDFTSSHLTG